MSCLTALIELLGSFSRFMHASTSTSQCLKITQKVSFCHIVGEVAWLWPISFRCLQVSLDQFSTKNCLLDKNNFETLCSVNPSDLPHSPFENVLDKWDIFGNFQTGCQLSIRSSSFPFLVSVLGIILHLTGKEKMNQHGLKGKLSDVYLNILTWLFSNILQVNICSSIYARFSS